MERAFSPEALERARFLRGLPPGKRRELARALDGRLQKTGAP